VRKQRVSDQPQEDYDEDHDDQEGDERHEFLSRGG
jgi:hypothetical protein